MKNILPLLWLLIAVTRLSGQQRPWPKADEAARFSASVTCIVLEEGADPFYNAAVSEAVSRYWNLTPTRRISDGEFSEMLSDPSYSFLVTNTATVSSDRSGTAYEYISLLLGSESGDLNSMPEFCTLPLCYEGMPADEYSYRLPLIIRFIEQHARQVAATPSNMALRNLKYYNRNVPDLQGKTLLLQESDLAPGVRSTAAIAAHYPGKVIIAGEEEIIRATEEQRRDVVILHMVAPDGPGVRGICTKMLIGTDDAVVYYYNTHNVDANNPAGLQTSDLKRISRY